MSMVDIIQWVMALVVVVAVVTIALVLIQRFGFRAAAQFFADVNASKPLLDAIEYAGRNVDPAVALAALDTLKLAAQTNADLVAAISELQKLIRAVTDGLPNATSEAQTQADF